MRLRTGSPPPDFVELRTWALDSLEDLTTVREELHRALTGVPAPDDRSLAEVPERIVLVASELATNALRYGHPPTAVRLLSDGREFVVDVVDHAPDVAPVVAPTRAPGRGGFGLLLAQRASRELGWYRSGRGAKHVWARFEVPAFRGRTARAHAGRARGGRAGAGLSAMAT